AIAGQAINRGCRTIRVDSCISNDDGSITVKAKGKTTQRETRNYGAKCVGRNALTYRCREGGKLGYEYCRTQCEAGESCSNGQCVLPCNPVAATACTAGVGCPGNTVIPAVGCPANQQCQEGVCLAALGSPCLADRECASNICGYNNSYHLVCEEPNNLGDICNWNKECSPAICGANEEEGRSVCEEPNQPLGARCANHFECASGICSFDDYGERRVCSERYRGGLGEPCDDQRECIRDLYCVDGMCGPPYAAPGEAQ
ncbi:MAG: hypothetical protein AABX37_01880, partial [Nanoarchaeota archaeon]